MTCPRCGVDLHHGYTMSWFTTEEICLDCKEEERGYPNYAKERPEERASLDRGERNFPGIGLAPEDLSYLAERRKARNTKGEV
jgi:hypothetical protein